MTKKPPFRRKIHEKTTTSTKNQRENHHFDEKSTKEPPFRQKINENTTISTTNQRKNHHFDEKSTKKPPFPRKINEKHPFLDFSPHSLDFSLIFCDFSQSTMTFQGVARGGEKM